MNSKKDIMKYAGAIAAIGGTIVLSSGLIADNKSLSKKVKKTASKAIGTIDHFFTDVQNMIK